MRHLVIYIYACARVGGASLRMRSVSGVCMMAAYVQILKSEFPQIDSEVFDYITGTVLLHNKCSNTHYSSLCAVVRV